MNALEKLDIKFGLVAGEGAFYGPKIEFGLKDSLGREWQCGVFQLDFLLSERLNSSFVNEDGKKEYPIVLHRAALGSLERFIAILLEHYNGELPLWLNPNAISILPISDKHLDYAKKIQLKLKEKNIIAIIDDSQNSLPYKIKNAYKLKSSACFIVGDKEVENNNIAMKQKNINSIINFDELNDLNFIIK